jgi:hypothetical protein
MKNTFEVEYLHSIDKNKQVTLGLKGKKWYCQVRVKHWVKWDILLRVILVDYTFIRSMSNSIKKIFGMGVAHSRL